MWIDKADPTSGHGRIQIAAHPTDGSVYLSGQFVGGLGLATAQLASAGNNDGVLARLDKDGKVVWARSFGDAQDQSFGPIAVDSTGNAYVEGITASAFAIDGHPVTPGFFIAKFGQDGQAQWVTNCGGPAPVFTGIGLSPDGVIAAGTIGGNLGVLNCGSTALNVANGKGFIVRLLSSGSEVWNHQLPVGGSDLAVDSTGSSILVGGITSPTNFGGGVLTPGGSSAIGGAPFVAKFAGSGTHAWSKTYSETGLGSSARGVTVDALGNIYFAGGFINSISVGLGPMNGATSDGGPDMFLAKLSGDGTGKWVRRLGDIYALSPFTQFGYGMRVAASGGDVVVFGNGALQLDGNSSMTEAFVAKLSTMDGSTLWTRDAGGGVSGVSMGPDREVFAAASFIGTLTIDNQTIKCDGCITTLDNGMFVAKLGR